MIALTGRATQVGKKEISKTFKLPCHAVRMTNDEFGKCVKGEFDAAVRWCREQAGVF
jgi:hypothetical protein